MKFYLHENNKSLTFAIYTPSFIGRVKIGSLGLINPSNSKSKFKPHFLPLYVSYRSSEEQLFN